MHNLAIASANPLQNEDILSKVFEFLELGKETCQAVQVCKAWYEARSNLTCAELIARLGRQTLRSRCATEAYLIGCRLVYPYLRHFHFGNALHPVKDRDIAFNIMSCLRLLKLQSLSVGDLSIQALSHLSDDIQNQALKLQQLLLPFPPANRFRIGFIDFPHISSNTVTKLEFVVRGSILRRHFEEIAVNFPQADSLVLIGHRQTEGHFDLCDLLAGLPFIRSLEFRHIGIGFSPEEPMLPLPSHAHLKYLKFTDCGLDQELSVEQLQPIMPQLETLVY